MKTIFTTLFILGSSLPALASTYPDLGTICTQDQPNGIAYLFSTVTFSGPTLSDKVNNGAQFKVLGYEDVEYEGETKEGIRLLLLSNPPGTSYPYDWAVPGSVLWDYSFSFDCIENRDSL